MSLFDQPDFLNKVEGLATAQAADRNTGSAFDDPDLLKGTDMEGYVYPADEAEPEMILELARPENEESENGIEVEITLEEEPENAGADDYENSLHTPCFDFTPDLDKMTVGALRKYLEDLRYVCELLEDDEPDPDCEEAMDIWESRKADLRDIVTDILDALDELTDIANDCDLDLM